MVVVGSGRGGRCRGSATTRPGSGFEADAAGGTHRRSRRHRQRGDVLVVLQRADRRGVAVLQVVPRPAGAEPLVVERLIVADDAAVDRRYAGGRERARSTRRARGAARSVAALIVGSPVPRTTRSPCSTPSSIVPVRLERRREAVVPAERLGRGRQRQDLHVGRRHHQLAGVVLEQTFARVERADRRRPRRRAPQSAAPKTCARSARSCRTAGAAERREADAVSRRACARRRRSRGRAPSGAIGWPRRGGA